LEEPLNAEPSHCISSARLKNVLQSLCMQG
jgi:hypothetical protein